MRLDREFLATVAVDVIIYCLLCTAVFLILKKIPSDHVHITYPWWAIGTMYFLAFSAFLGIAYISEYITRGIFWFFKWAINGG